MKKHLISFIVFSLPLVLSATVNQDITELKLENKKLANQVNYLINAQNKVSSEQVQQRLNKLSGQIEVNGYKIQQLNDVVTQKLKQFEQKLERLGKTVNKPSPRQLYLARDNAAFDKANQLLINKKYDQAIPAFKKYLKDYYNGEHYSESLYLLGQIYLIKEKTDLAYDQFKTIVTRYPKSIKIPPATYSLGLLELAKGNIKTGKKYLESVVIKYPNTDAATQSKAQLKAL